MALELIYTSAPAGLRTGTRGFCTVASTKGMARNQVDLCESLSAYSPVYQPHEPDAHKNPVAFSHFLFNLGGTRYSVLSRVADAGTDYTGRTNKLAHHILLRPVEYGIAGPAATMMVPGFFCERWSAEPHEIDGEKRVPAGVLSTERAQHWHDLAGDAGWAGVLAQSFLDAPERPAFVVFEPGMSLLRLLAESLALLPESVRWQVTFSTYATSLPNASACAWRCCVRDSAVHRVANRTHGALVVDLSVPGPVPADRVGPLVDLARTGGLPLPPAATVVVVPSANGTEAADVVAEVRELAHGEGGSGSRSALAPPAASPTKEQNSGWRRREARRPTRQTKPGDRQRRVPSKPGDEDTIARRPVWKWLVVFCAPCAFLCLGLLLAKRPERATVVPTDQASVLPKAVKDGDGDQRARAESILKVVPTTDPVATVTVDPMPRAEEGTSPAVSQTRGDPLDGCSIGWVVKPAKGNAKAPEPLDEWVLFNLPQGDFDVGRPWTVWDVRGETQEVRPTEHVGGAGRYTLKISVDGASQTLIMQFDDRKREVRLIQLAGLRKALSGIAAFRMGNDIRMVKTPVNLAWSPDRRRLALSCRNQKLGLAFMRWAEAMTFAASFDAAGGGFSDHLNASGRYEQPRGIVMELPPDRLREDVLGKWRSAQERFRTRNGQLEAENSTFSDNAGLRLSRFEGDKKEHQKDRHKGAPAKDCQRCKALDNKINAEKAAIEVERGRLRGLQDQCLQEMNQSVWGVIQGKSAGYLELVEKMKVPAPSEPDMAKYLGTVKLSLASGIECRRAGAASPTTVLEVRSGWLEPALTVDNTR